MNCLRNDNEYDDEMSPVANCRKVEVRDQRNGRPYAMRNISIIRSVTYDLDIAGPVKYLINFIDIPAHFTIKKAILSAESSVKEFIFGSNNQSEESEIEKLGSESAKKHP
ncbi:hypothetical protein FEM48_Zijuj07G0157000 [Ziziphus jujuba var. spinosa]|uniref:Uncharacterized protein n=1 Tax=Ziziphus jujuba var. spinosa TaxID=714518 RepID=A0A978V5H8_ZIZJJ|nr:hypothetical protein FEM48_Zijuj07G0157000 [Ziziphus jujuba var. spinosa]